MNFWFGCLQIFLLILMVFISVFKPWGKMSTGQGAARSGDQ